MAVGGDVRWATPLRGFILGSSIENQGVEGNGPEGTLHVEPISLTAYYAEWTKGKWYFAGEYWRMPYVATLQAGADSFVFPIDQRSWYPMVSYQRTKKLQLGSYYGHSINKAADYSQPENYSKDWAISGRYNFNSNFYARMEVHFLHGK